MNFVGEKRVQAKMMICPFQRPLPELSRMDF